MADLFKSLKPKANLSRNGFDLSRKHVFSSKAGQALPVLAIETVPGDHHEIDVTALARTRTMNTAAFLRGKMRYDFFFVPNSQSWHAFNQFVTQRNDKHSTTQGDHIFCPVVNLRDLLIHIYSEYENQGLDVHGYSFADGMIRILDLLGYGDFRWLLNVSSADIVSVVSEYDGKYVNLFRLAAYQHIWYDYYRNKYFDVDGSGGITSIDPDLHPRDYLYGFNFDDLNCGTFANSVLNTGTWSNQQPDQDAMRCRMLLKMNYIQWKKDLFTSALPSQQFGAVSSVDISNVNIYSDESYNASRAGVGVKSDNTLALSYRELVPVGSNNVSLQRNGDNASSTWSIPSAFDVLSLRKAEALQAWKQNTLRAGNMTDDQWKAHFGTTPYYDNDENVRYLGSVSSALQVNAVEATSSTGQGVNSSVGDLAATGTCVIRGNKVQFDARDFGIIMCIASFLPESEYSSNCLDKANTLYEQFDFYTPEFANIGLEPVTMFQHKLGGLYNTDLNTVLGYAPRYYMYKQAFDKVFGEFKDTESFNISGLTPGTPISANGSYESWVAPRQEYIANNNRGIGTFYVSPAVLDNIFGVTADASQSTDQFINNVYFDVKSIRPMSVLGLPQF